MKPIFIIAIILLLLALFWEFKDYSRLQKRPMISKLKTSKDKLKELKFYACYNSENAIFWRSGYIVAAITVYLIYLSSKMFNTELNEHLLILMFLSVFLTQYFMNNFKTFHLYRVMSSKVVGKSVL